MSLNKMDLFHGALLTKVVRQSREYSLRLIEANTDKGRRVYQINGISILVKYSAPVQEARSDGTLNWTFNFQEDERKYLEEGGVEAIALVCGFDSASDFDDMEVCLLEGEKFDKFGALVEETQWSGQLSVRVRAEFRKALRVRAGDGTREITIIRSRIDNWDLPK